jgi:hypothetical protein
MTEAESERLSRNLVEVIDDLYRQHAPPRDHERLIQLVTEALTASLKSSWLTPREARRTFGDALTYLPPESIVDHKIGRRVVGAADRRAQSAATARGDELQR